VARPGASGFAAASAESNVNIASDSPEALSARDAGSHGVEKPEEPPGAFKGCACTKAKQSATTSEKPNAKLADLRSMARSYTHMDEGCKPFGRAATHRVFAAAVKRCGGEIHQNA